MGPWRDRVLLQVPQKNPSDRDDTRWGLRKAERRGSYLPGWDPLPTCGWAKGRQKQYPLYLRIFSCCSGWHGFRVAVSHFLIQISHSWLCHAQEGLPALCLPGCLTVLGSHAPSSPSAAAWAPFPQPLMPISSIFSEHPPLHPAGPGQVSGVSRSCFSFSSSCWLLPSLKSFRPSSCAQLLGAVQQAQKGRVGRLWEAGSSTWTHRHWSQLCSLPALWSQASSSHSIRLLGVCFPFYKMKIEVIPASYFCCWCVCLKSWYTCLGEVLAHGKYSVNVSCYLSVKCMLLFLSYVVYRA